MFFKLLSLIIAALTDTVERQRKFRRQLLKTFNTGSPTLTGL